MSSSSRAWACSGLGVVRRVKVCSAVADADGVAADGGEVGEEVGEGVGGVPVRGGGAPGFRAGGGGAGRWFDGVGWREWRFVCEQQFGETRESSKET